MRKRLVLGSIAALGLVAILPAAAATPIFKGTVGPGFTITMAKKPTKAGKIKLVISDKSNIHDFHLVGPGVNVATSVSGTGTKTFVIKHNNSYHVIGRYPAVTLKQAREEAKRRIALRYFVPTGAPGLTMSG